MTEVRDLLVEVGTEELPPKALRRLMDALGENLAKGLEQTDLGHGALTPYASPRRLAILVEDLAAQQNDRAVERRGPAVGTAFNRDGSPTRAATGFAKSCGVPVEQLATIETEKGAWLYYRGRRAGLPTVELIPGLVQDALDKLPIPRRMRWGAGIAEFVRPVHWVILLYGDETVSAELLGVASDAITRGHRFHCPEPFAVRSPRGYLDQLERDGRVIADFDRRRRRVESGVLSAASELNGVAVIDEELLEEVTALVEWPVPVAGRFDESFLEVPQEALISSMQGHQKYFPVRAADGRLLPYFITVANIESKSPEQVRRGNERVIRPRLADAAFFWEQDRRRRLETRVQALRKVVFQEKLGSVQDKAERVAALCDYLAEQLKEDRGLARRAALLSKCDLDTAMVGEFPELQGIMGRYYASGDGEHLSVAEALEDQYKPRFAGDEVAASPIGQILAVADRADTLAGIFAIGMSPTGEKDPFGLRRAAVGLLRTAIESGLNLDLEELLEHAVDALPDELGDTGTVTGIFEFCMDRLKGYYHEHGLAPELFQAVYACRPTRPLEFHRRILACREFAALSESASLTAANKRIRNIIQKSEDAVPGQAQPALLLEPEERDLYAALEAAKRELEPLVTNSRYTEALKRLAALRSPVDRFFDRVLVMVENNELRRNRLALLQSLANLFLQIADVSRLPSP